MTQYITKSNLATLALVLVMFSIAIVSPAQTGEAVAIFLKGGEARFGRITEFDNQGNVELVNECGIFKFSASEIDSIKPWNKASYKGADLQNTYIYTHTSANDNDSDKPYISPDKGYYNYSSLALLFGQGQNGLLPVPSLTTVNGWQINKRLFTGIGIGYEYYEWSVMPVFADIKYMLGSDNFIPYGSFKIGYSFPISKPSDVYDDYNNNASKYYGGIQVSPEAGFRILLSDNTSLMMSIGYHFQQLSYRQLNYYWWNNTGNESTVHTDFNRISLRVGFLF